MLKNEIIKKNIESWNWEKINKKFKGKKKKQVEHGPV